MEGRRPPDTAPAGQCGTLTSVAYDIDLADRLRSLLRGQVGLSERAMFGGLAFLVDGHLAAAAMGQGGMLLRIDPADIESLVTQAHVERFEMRGRAMDGWLRVEVDALGTEDELRRWVDHGVLYARSLPQK